MEDHKTKSNGRKILSAKDLGTIKFISDSSFDPSSNENVINRLLPYIEDNSSKIKDCLNRFSLCQEDSQPIVFESLSSETVKAFKHEDLRIYLNQKRDEIVSRQREIDPTGIGRAIIDFNSKPIEQDEYVMSVTEKVANNSNPYDSNGVKSNISVRVDEWTFRDRERRTSSNNIKKKNTVFYLDEISNKRSNNAISMYSRDRSAKFKFNTNQENIDENEFSYDNIFLPLALSICKDEVIAYEFLKCYESLNKPEANRFPSSRFGKYLFMVTQIISNKYNINDRICILDDRIISDRSLAVDLCLYIIHAKCCSSRDFLRSLIQTSNLFILNSIPTKVSRIGQNFNPFLHQFCYIHPILSNEMMPDPTLSNYESFKSFVTSSRNSYGVALMIYRQSIFRHILNNYKTFQMFCGTNIPSQKDFESSLLSPLTISSLTNQNTIFVNISKTSIPNTPLPPPPTPRGGR